MKVLILTHYFPPEPGSAAMRMFELAEYLVNHGHRVTVVTGFPNYPEGIIYEEYRGKVFKREQLNGITVVRTFVYTSKQRRKFLPRLMNYLSFMVTSVFGAISASKHDIIYVYSPPPFLGFSAYLIGKLHRIHFVFEVNDLWPKGPIALGIIRNKYLIKLAQQMEKFIYRKAEKIFVYSNRMGKDIIATGVDRQKVELHPLWVDTDFFRPEPDVDSVRAQYGLNNKFVVLYAGLIGLAQGLDHVIECARLLQERKEIMLALVGDGVEKKRLMQKKESYELNNVRFIPQQPKEAMPRFLSAVDVLLIHLNRAPHRLGTVPAKLLAYMGCGRPVLAAVNGETADIVNKSKCGVVVQPQDPQAMADAALNLYENEELRERFAENARTYAVRYFDQKKLLSQLENRLHEIIGR